MHHRSRLETFDWLAGGRSLLFDGRTCLCVALSHTLAARAAALDVTKYAVDVAGATPFLMRQDIAANSFLTGLNKLHVCEHALVLESA